MFILTAAVRLLSAALWYLFFFIGLLVAAVAAHGAFLKNSRPVISKHILEGMSCDAIRKAYPQGIRVTNKNVSDYMAQKLENLSRAGYPIIWYMPEYEKLQAHALYVVRQDRFLFYLSMLFSAQTHCSSFFQDYMSDPLNQSKTVQVEHPREGGVTTAQSADSILKNHQHWKNLGYASMAQVPREILSWLEKNGREAESTVKVELHKCRIELPPGRLTEASQLVVLQYLYDAVNGLYYLGNASPLTHYRKLAVDSLATRKVCH